MNDDKKMIDIIKKLNNMDNINIDVNSNEGKMLVEVVKKHSTIKDGNEKD